MCHRETFSTLNEDKINLKHFYYVNKVIKILYFSSQEIDHLFKTCLRLFCKTNITQLIFIG